MGDHPPILQVKLFDKLEYESDEYKMYNMINAKRYGFYTQSKQSHEQGQIVSAFDKNSVVGKLKSPAP